jgi:hypothetical protein
MKVLLSAVLLFTLISIAEAPTMPYYFIRVRLTTYSAKQPKETSVTSLGKCAKNENGVAVPKGFLPYGTKIILPNGNARKVDDRVPNKSARKFNYKVVDTRYYETITARPKSKQVNKQLRKLDMGYGFIKVKIPQ